MFRSKDLAALLQHSAYFTCIGFFRRFKASIFNWLKAHILRYSSGDSTSKQIRANACSTNLETEGSWKASNKLLKLHVIGSNKKVLVTSTNLSIREDVCSSSSMLVSRWPLSFTSCSAAAWTLEKAAFNVNDLIHKDWLLFSTSAVDRISLWKVQKISAYLLLLLLLLIHGRWQC